MAMSNVNLIGVVATKGERPDMGHLALSRVEDLEGGGLRLRADATNSDIAYDPRVARRYPLLVDAILAGASPRLRSAATSGGNLSQRMRCYYFSESETARACVSARPSGMGVALATLDAQVRIARPAGERFIPVADACRLSADRCWAHDPVCPAEEVMSIDLPAEDFTQHYAYLKVRGLLSHGLVPASVAVVLRLDGDRVSEARIALGGLAHGPWRSAVAESGLAGEKVSHTAFVAAAHATLDGVVGDGGADFEVESARWTIVRALEQAAHRHGGVAEV